MIKGDDIVYDVADAKMYFLRGLGLPIMGFSGLVYFVVINFLATVWIK